MLMVGSRLIGIPVLSLHIGGRIANVRRPIIDPETLAIIAFELEGAALNDPEAGNYLMSRDIRETGMDGLVVDSSDRFVNPDDVIRLEKVLDLGFELVGLKVVSKQGRNLKKLGKVVDYTVDSMTLSIFQIIAQRPLLASLNDPQLTINRSQITEIDDYTVTIRHEKQQVRVKPKRKKEPTEEFIPSYTNPFRKPDYPSTKEEKSDSASSISE